MIVVFVSNDGGHRPGLNTMARREGRPSVKKIAATFGGSGPAPLRDFFEPGDDDRAVEQSLGAQHSGFPGARIVSGSPHQIKGQGDAADSVTRSTVANHVAGMQLTSRLANLISRSAIGGDQRGSSQPNRRQPASVALVQMKRRSPNRYLIVQDVTEKFMLERRRG